ncbi:unnamed protein product [Protopolystoma xenopodis]|uniref:Uncharacterized protein n=1 Tax=Protopolystoma xenopodis TaxID=117903 RepID=A0A448WM92_9PLAT|nr:unnamed protein product [Protopolystoma xenopodis]
MHVLASVTGRRAGSDIYCRRPVVAGEVKRQANQWYVCVSACLRVCKCWCSGRPRGGETSCRGVRLARKALATGSSWSRVAGRPVNRSPGPISSERDVAGRRWRPSERKIEITGLFEDIVIQFRLWSQGKWCLFGTIQLADTIFVNDEEQLKKKRKTECLLERIWPNLIRSIHHFANPKSPSYQENVVSVANVTVGQLWSTSLHRMYQLLPIGYCLRRARANFRTTNTWPVNRLQERD